MGRGRWTFERIVAAVQAVAGLAVVAMFVTLGVGGSGPDRTAFDRWFPFAVAAFALVVTVWVVARGLRRARRVRRAPDDS